MDSSRHHKKSKKNKIHKRKRSKSSRRSSTDDNPSTDDGTDGPNYHDIDMSPPPRKRKKSKHRHKNHKSKRHHADNREDMKITASGNASPDDYNSSSDQNTDSRRPKSHVQNLSEQHSTHTTDASASEFHHDKPKETLDYDFDFLKYKTSLGKIFFRDKSMSAIALRLVS